MEKETKIETDDKPKSPYVGLIPYSDREAQFFFGRETETEIISANLRSARLTVLYGTSGVGKSSVLQAGVVHHLRQLAAEDAKTYGQAEFAVVTYRNWAGNPLKGIAEALREAVAESLGVKAEILEPVPETNDFVKLLQSWSQRYGLELLIILDQFEAMFNYLTDKRSPCAVFAGELAKAVNTPDCPARFLISLGGDTLSLLDYFKETIPGLFDNRLQLQHLTAPKAKDAITKPIETYNELYKPAKVYEIEPELVNEVIEQIKIGRNEPASGSAAVIANISQTPVIKDTDETYVETPYLQLVMKRIWREETEANSNVLHLKTLTGKLGGTKQIIQTHLNEVLDKMTDAEQRIASKCFKYLVTPMGTKIALSSAALAKYTECDEKEVGAVLELLVKGKIENKSLDINLPVGEQEAAIVNKPDEARILRNVEIPVGKTRLPGYEVTHDAYIPAILDWRERYIIEHDIFNLIKSKGRKIAPYLGLFFCVVLIYSLGLLALTYKNWTDLGVIKKEATNVNANKDEQQVRENKIKEEEKNIANKNDDVEITAKKILEREASYKKLITILIGLSNDSAAEREKAFIDLKLQIEAGKVPKEYQESIIQVVKRIDGNKAAELDELLKITQGQKPENQIKPRIYIHFTVENQKERAEFFQDLLKQKEFNTPKIEFVGNIKITNTQIRYFRQEDLDLANEVVNILQNEGVQNVRAQLVGGYEKRAKHLEIWFAPDAFSESVRQTAK